MSFYPSRTRAQHTPPLCVCACLTWRRVFYPLVFTSQCLSFVFRFLYGVLGGVFGVAALVGLSPSTCRLRSSNEPSLHANTRHPTIEWNDHALLPLQTSVCTFLASHGLITPHHSCIRLIHSVVYSSRPRCASCCKNVSGRKMSVPPYRTVAAGDWVRAHCCTLRYSW